jgi:hypothetical protein
VGASMNGFVVRWNPKTKALAGFQIEQGDDIEDTVSLMKATDFDPDSVDVLARGVKPGKTKKSFFMLKRSSTVFEPMLTQSEIFKIAALAHGMQ